MLAVPTDLEADYERWQGAMAAYLYAVCWQAAVLIQHKAHVLLNIQRVEEGPILKHHAHLELTGKLLVICQ